MEQKAAFVLDEDDIREAGPDDVSCDVCTGKKTKAFRSCLQCMVSYCKLHLRPHLKSPAFAKHGLVEPRKNLQEEQEKTRCARHNEATKIFCRTDQRCICYLCSMEEHQGHDVVSAATAAGEKHGELQASLEKIRQKIANRESVLKALEQTVDKVNGLADEAVAQAEEILEEWKQQVRSGQDAEVVRVKGLQEKLRQEVAELRRTDEEMEKLQLGMEQEEEDHARFLTVYTSLSAPSAAGDSSGIGGDQPRRYREQVEAAVSEVREKLQGLVVSGGGSTQNSPTVDSLEEEPQTRAALLKHSCPLTLDTNTAHYNLRNYSRGRNAVCYPLNVRPYGHPDEFLSWNQILCREGLTGRCYWEVDWSGKEVFVAVAYKDIRRQGEESVFGHNNRSWALQCWDGGYEFRHNDIRMPVSGPPHRRVGVYLDHDAGTLSFHSVSENGSTTLLHRVQTVFSRPLCPGFGLHSGGDRAEINNVLYVEQDN